MRLGDFRVIFYYGTRRWELYNLANDLGETRDLSVRQPERLKEMGDRMHQELERMNAQWPVDESTGQDVRPIVP
jgi:arylsulfatase A-like enzyme